MTKYRISVSSYIIVEAGDKDEAFREVEAIQESLANKTRLPHNEERDLMLNAEVESIDEELEDNS